MHRVAVVHLVISIHKTRKFGTDSKIYVPRDYNFNYTRFRELGCALFFVVNAYCFSCEIIQLKKTLERVCWNIRASQARACSPAI
jgi:hypothetical protein